MIRTPKSSVPCNDYLDSVQWKAFWALRPFTSGLKKPRDARDKRVSCVSLVPELQKIQGNEWWLWYIINNIICCENAKFVLVTRPSFGQITSMDMAKHRVLHVRSFHPRNLQKFEVGSTHRLPEFAHSNDGSFICPWQAPSSIWQNFSLAFGVGIGASVKKKLRSIAHQGVTPLA